MLSLSAAHAQTTASGASGLFSLPTPSAVPDGKVRFGLGGSYFRGGDFLLPGSTSQRSGGDLALAVGFGGFGEAYGSLSLTSTNLFSVESRRTLVSAGDADLGVKLLLPGGGPFSAGALLQADLPAGVGGVSFTGAGARAAIMLGYAAPWFVVSAIAGYRFDNSYKLVSGTPATFPAFALAISSYDVVYGGATLQVPWRYATPAIEWAAESAIPRQNALPHGDTPVRSRIALGVSDVFTGVANVKFSAALQMSLTNAGRISEVQLPSAGFAPDAPWTLLAGLSWTFERPSVPRAPQWHQPSDERQPEPPAQAIAQPKPRRAVLHVVVLDAKSKLPLAGAWVSFLEGSDAGGTTGPEGNARVEIDPGQVTLAVVRDGYELTTRPMTLAAGSETQVTMELSAVPPDSTVRGRLVGEDGQPLRATVLVLAAGALPTLSGAPAIFEGGFAIGISHGAYELQAVAPGYRAAPQQLTLRPGETVTRDIVLGRIAGEPRVRASGEQVEVSVPLQFEGANVAQASLPLVSEIAQALRQAKLPFDVIARGSTDVEAEARAIELVRLLKARGVKVALTPKGAGVAAAGQPLFEVKQSPLELPPRTQLPAPHAIFASRGAR
jgi:hypothetical protein